jgi:hypothetical protein
MNSDRNVLLAIFLQIPTRNVGALSVSDDGKQLFFLQIMPDGPQGHFVNVAHTGTMIVRMFSNTAGFKESIYVCGHGAPDEFTLPSEA